MGMREHYPKIEKDEDDICRQQRSYKPVWDYHLPPFGKCSMSS